VRAALRRDDKATARELAEVARAVNGGLPDAEMVADVYPVLVDVLLAAGDDVEARRVAREGMDRRGCRATFAAAAMAHRGSPKEAAYRRRAAEATA
jgi:serine/threonine-protein kinase